MSVASKSTADWTESVGWRRKGSLASKTGVCGSVSSRGVSRGGQERQEAACPIHARLTELLGLRDDGELAAGLLDLADHGLRLGRLLALLGQDRLLLRLEQQQHGTSGSDKG